MSKRANAVAKAVKASVYGARLVRTIASTRGPRATATEIERIQGELGARGFGATGDEIRAAVASLSVLKGAA